MKKLDVVETKLKAKSETPGNKAFAIYSIMQHLEKSMIKDSASARDVMQFEKDFLEMNGIAIPTSFMFIAQNSVEKFIDDMIVEADENLTGTDFYLSYITYCATNELKPLGKQDVFCFLRSKGLLFNRGTINGKTMNNILKNKKIRK